MTIDNTSSVTSEISKVIEHEAVFYLNEEFWVAMAFVLAICVIFSPVKKALNDMIIKRIVRIKNELQNAESIKLKAQKLYAEYERKFANVDAEVAQILVEQENAISAQKEQKINNLNIFLRQKQKEVDGRIDLAFEQANAEINSLVSAKTRTILKNVISAKLTKSDYNRLINNSINNIQKHL